ncbi:MAG: hypothetical protein GY714_25805, partial [Desulfobacterales bacterium]|nr:hypothetical protein [Desulfobacterales bacterium]
MDDELKKFGSRVFGIAPDIKCFRTFFMHISACGGGKRQGSTSHRSTSDISSC